MLDLKINKNTIKSYIRKLKEKGVKEVKIFLVSHFNSMTYCEEEINETRIVPIEQIEEYVKDKNVYFYLDVEKKVIEVRCFFKFCYHIIDENFEELKKAALTKFVAKNL
jgi:tagatose-1,6-bisphosphate aldolase